jgi:hypothetical protein
MRPLQLIGCHSRQEGTAMNRTPDVPVGCEPEAPDSSVGAKSALRHEP